MGGDLLELAALAAVAVAGGWLADRIGVPGGAILGAIVAVAAVGIALDVQHQPPEPLRFVALALIGWVVGESLDQRARASLRRAAVPIALSLGLLGAVVAVLAVVVHAAFGLDPTTALMVVVPGGLTNMVALAVAIDVDPLPITVIHQVRVLVVVAVTPLVLRWVLARQSRPDDQPPR